MIKLGEKDQILKCREDHKPLYFKEVTDPDDGSIKYQLFEESKCSWQKKEEMASVDKFRPRIEPWLTALFQSEHLSLLVGSGLAHAIHRIAVSDHLTACDFDQLQVSI